MDNKDYQEKMFWMIDEENRQVLFSSDKNNFIKYEDEWGFKDELIGYTHGIDDSKKIIVNETTTEIPFYMSAYCQEGMEYLVFDNDFKVGN